jgi:hypothetical protein
MSKRDVIADIGINTGDMMSAFNEDVFREWFFVL